MIIDGAKTFFFMAENRLGVPGVISPYLHPSRLTWNIIMEVWFRSVSFEHG